MLTKLIKPIQEYILCFLPLKEYNKIPILKYSLNYKLPFSLQIAKKVAETNKHLHIVEYLNTCK